MERRPSIEMGNTKVKAEQRKRTPSRRWMEIHKESWGAQKQVSRKRK